MMDIAWHAWRIPQGPPVSLARACLVDGKLEVVERSRIEMRAGEEGGCGEQL